VTKDWDLTLLTSRRDDPEYPFGLRRNRYFQVKELYYFVVALDLLLRFTWSIKLSPHLDRFNDIEGGIFILQLLEIFRRWVWVFFRVETEWGEFEPCARTFDMANFAQSEIVAARHWMMFY